MASLSEERLALNQDRAAFVVREAQLAAVISSLGLKVPPPTPGGATAQKKGTDGAVTTKRMQQSHA